MKRTITVTEKEWKTIHTALKIEAERNADLDADEDQRKVQADIQAAIEAVQKATSAGLQEGLEMSDTLKDLIERYATHYDLSVKEATKRYQEGRVNKRDLLESYLHDEGIFGYTYSLWRIFEALKEG